MAGLTISARVFGLGAAIVFLSTAPPAAAAPTRAASNPLFAPSPLPFHAPQFDKIRDSDFVPAFEEAMRRKRAQIARIANNPAPPTFENTLVAMEQSGQMLERVTNVFYALAEANTDDALQRVQAREAPRLAALHDAIYLNPKLFARVEAVYKQRDQLHLDPESRQLVKVTYDDFIHAGARLSAADKVKLRRINAHLSSLQVSFERKLLAATRAAALIVDDKSELAGLGPAAIAAAADAARAHGLTGKWLIPLQNTTQQPALSRLDKRAVRKELFENSWMRTERGDKNDTRQTIATIALLRAEKARLLGFPNYAAYVLENQMAKTPAAVESFMAQLVAPTQAKAAAERMALQTLVEKGGKHFKLEPWDWAYYAARLRKVRYGIDENEIRPYLELNNVLEKGVFYAAHELYGLTFKERHDLPVYQKDVRVFEVFDHDGSSLGLIYFDYFRRDNKAGGAWMSNFVEQSKLLGNKPVVYNVANFAKPAPGHPALLTFDDVTTMFHEFGHALHSLLADEEYPSLSGTNVARDFVEFPSQFNEHWALYPRVLEHYAINYKTGRPLPQALVDRIKAAAKSDQGYKLGELLAAAELDMRWHSLPAIAPRENVDQFETTALKLTHTDFPDVPPRYRSSYFLHIWANNYAAGYYAYLWTEMLDDDAFHWITEHGGLTRANGQRFRELILSRGHSEDYGPMFRAFYGRAPDVGPMLEHRGLAPSGG